MEKRKCGIDIFRIMCCIGVLVYHVVDDVLEAKGANALYYGASFCIPGFFLLAGYLVAGKTEISLQYFETKIKSYIQKLFGWILLCAVIHFFKTGDIVDIWYEFTAGAKSSGMLPVSWFLYTYIFLMFLAYPMLKFKNKCPWIFDAITLCWIVLLACGVGKKFVDTLPQALWTHLYLGYFALGMAIYDISIKWKTMNKKIETICICVIFLVSSIVYKQNYMNGMPHQHYGGWYYSLWLISIFLIILRLNIDGKKVGKVLKKISENTFTVYLGHLPILIFITGFFPLKNLVEAVGMIIFLFVILNLVAEIFRRLPLLRKIV